MKDDKYKKARELFDVIKLYQSKCIKELKEGEKENEMEN